MLKTYRVCITATEITKNYITIEAEDNDEAIIAAREEWYNYGSNAFSSKCIDETLEDIEAEEEGE